MLVSCYKLSGQVHSAGLAVTTLPSSAAGDDGEIKDYHVTF